MVIEFVSTKELWESSGYERWNEWHQSPLHAADFFPTCCHHSCSTSTTTNLTPLLPITLLAGYSCQAPNSEGGIASNIPNPFPSPLNREGSRSKHSTSDPGGLNPNLNSNHNRENTWAETVKLIQTGSLYIGI